MSEDVGRLLDDKLKDGEELLWTGSPETFVLITSADILLVPVSIWIGAYIIHTGLSIIQRSVASDYSLGQVIVGVIGGLPFIVMGLYLTLGRFIYKNWHKRHTVYAVTNTRVLSISDLGRIIVRDQPIDEIPDLRKSSGRGGLGTITFGKSPFAASWCGNTGMNCLAGFDKADLIAFHDIKGADEVYSLVYALMHQSRNEENKAS